MAPLLHRAAIKNAVPANEVPTSSAVPTWLTGTLVYVLLTVGTLEPHVAEAPVGADTVETGRAVAARHRSTLVYLRLAVAAVVADWTVAFVRTPDVAASSAVDTLVT